MNKGEESNNNIDNSMYQGKMAASIVIALSACIILFLYRKPNKKTIPIKNKKSLNLMIGLLIILALIYILNLIISIVYYKTNTIRDKEISIVYIVISIIVIIILIGLYIGSYHDYIKRSFETIKSIEKNRATTRFIESNFGSSPEDRTDYKLQEDWRDANKEINA